MASRAELALILSLVDEVSGTAKAVKKDLEAVGLASQGAQGTLRGVGEGLMTLGSRAVLSALGVVTAAVSAIGAASVMAARDLESAKITIIAGTGASGEAFESLLGSARAVGRQVPQGFTAAAEAVTMLNTLLGIEGDALEKGSKATVDFARVNKVDVAAAANMAGRGLNALELDADQLIPFLDRLTKAAQLSGMSALELGQAVIDAGPAFVELGFNTDRAIGLFASSAKAGVDPREIISSISLALNTLVKSQEEAGGATMTAQEAFEDYISRIKDAPSYLDSIRLANELFGARVGGKIADDIRAGRFEVEDWEEILAKSAGTLDDVASRTLTMGEKFAVLKNRGLDALTPVAEQLLSLANVVWDRLEPAINVLSEWFSDSLAPAIEAAMPGIVDLIDAFLWLAQGDVASFLDLVWIGLEQVGSAFGLTHEQMEPFLEALWDITIAVSEFVQNHAEELKVALIAIGGLLAAGAIAAGITAIVGAIGALLNPVTLVVAAVGLLAAAWAADWGGIRTTLTEAWTAIQPTLQTVADWLSVKVPEAIAWMRDAIAAALEFVRGLWAKHGDETTATVSGLWETVTEAFGAAIDWIKGVVGDFLELIRDWWSAHGESVVTVVTVLWQCVQDVFSLVIEIITGIVGAFVATVVWLWETFGDEILQTASNAWELIQRVFENALDIIGSVFDLFAAAFTGDWRAAGEALWDIVEEIWDTIEAIFSTAWENLSLIVNQIIDSIKGAFTGIDWGEIGTNIIEGIKTGITNAAGALWEAAKSAASGALDAAKNFLGIHSPSTVFAGVGQNLMQGFAQGIRRSAGLPAAASANAAQQVTNAVTRSSSVIYNYNLTAQYGGYQAERSLRSDVRLLSLMTGGA